MKPTLDLSDPRPDFKSLSECEVWAALHDTPGTSPVAAEVMRLVCDYVRNFQAHFLKNGDGMPSRRVTMEWPVEKVAMKVMMAFIVDQTAERFSSNNILH